MDTTNNVQGVSGIDFPTRLTAGDVFGYGTWWGAGRTLPLAELGAKGVAILDKTEEEYVTVHRNFLGTAAGIYYGTPSARYAVLSQIKSALDPSKRDEGSALVRTGRKPHLTWSNSRDRGGLGALLLERSPAEPIPGTPDGFDDIWTQFLA